jgi:hypothetical protein
MSTQTNKHSSSVNPVSLQSPCQGTLQVPPWTLNGFIPEADVPDKGAEGTPDCLMRKHLCSYSGSRGQLLKTVGRRDAAIERTGTYLQRVLRSCPLGLE